MSKSDTIVSTLIKKEPARRQVPGAGHSGGPLGTSGGSPEPPDDGDERARMPLPVRRPRAVFQDAKNDDTQ